MPGVDQLVGRWHSPPTQRESGKKKATTEAREGGRGKEGGGGMWAVRKYQNFKTNIRLVAKLSPAMHANIIFSTCPTTTGAISYIRPADFLSGGSNVSWADRQAIQATAKKKARPPAGLSRAIARRRSFGGGLPVTAASITRSSPPLDTNA